MRRFLLRRLVHAVIVVWGVVTVVFFLVRLTGDPAAFLVDQAATREEVAAVQRQLGLDRPWIVQYLDFLAAVPRGDFGTSIRERRPAMHMVFQHFWPATVELAAAAIALSTVLAIPLGIVSATRKDRAADHASRIASLFLQSMPSFWLGLMLILLFAVELNGLLPAYRVGEPASSDPARRHARRRAARPERAPHPRRDARGAPAGLRPHRARQGGAGAACALSPCAPERGPARS